MKIEERPISTIHENHFVISKILDIPASRVWQTVAEEYGDIYKSNPFVFESNWIGWDTEVRNGVQRTAVYNEDGSKALVEEMTELNEAEFTFKTKVVSSKNIEVNASRTGLTYRIVPVVDTACRLELEVQSNTLPSFVGSVKRELFEEMVKGYILGIEHHIKTGEEVTFAVGKKLLREEG